MSETQDLANLLFSIKHDNEMIKKIREKRKSEN